MLAVFDLAQDGLDFADLILGTEQIGGLADDLVAGVAVQPLCSRVPARDDAVQGAADDGIVRMLDNRCQPVQPATIRFRSETVAYVTHRRHHQHAVPEVHRGQNDVYRELCAVGSAS